MTEGIAKETITTAATITVATAAATAEPEGLDATSKDATPLTVER